MSHIFAYILAIVITFPIVVTVVLYYICKKIYRHPKKALHVSIAYSTLFYIVSVMIMLNQIFESSYSGIIVIFLLVTLMSFVLLQWKLTEEIIFKRAWKLFWRSMFLVFLVAYIMIGLTGIILNIINL